MSASVRVFVADQSDVAEVRRGAARLAARPQFRDTALGGLAIVATELATNLLKHAGGGEILLRPAEVRGVPVVELLAVDRGPGIRDVAGSLRDGYSTSGSPGTGLGAIRRLSATFDLYSTPGAGTVVLARVAPGPVPAPPPGASLEIGVICVPVRGEHACGDAVAVRAAGNSTLVLVVDALGHGAIAAETAQVAVEVFARGSRTTPVDLLRDVNDALRSTRGAVGAVAQIDRRATALRYAGVGNITSRLSTGDGTRNLVSQNGMLGSVSPRILDHDVPWSGGPLVIHSDGIGTRWALDDYPGLAGREPSLVAGVLYRDHDRRTDDATVVVVGERGSLR